MNLEQRGSLSPSEDSLVFGPFTLMPGRRELLRHGAPVTLGSRALEILIALAERAGEVIGARELIQRGWPHATVGDANLRVQIASLRKVLGDSTDGARFIAAHFRAGVCLRCPGSSERAAIGLAGPGGPSETAPAARNPLRA